MSEITLTAGDLVFRLRPDAEEPGWIRVTLWMEGTWVQLGADGASHLRTHLLDRLLAPGLPGDEPASGTVEGRPVWWVLTLAEGHCTAYAAFGENERTLYVQDADAVFFAQATLTPADCARWRRQLESFPD